MEEIKQLAVHSLDGEFYRETRKYLARQGCTWAESRGGAGELLEVYLTFPPGTFMKRLPAGEKCLRYQIIFANGGVLYWSIKRENRKNAIYVPYVCL